MCLHGWIIKRLSLKSDSHSVTGQLFRMQFHGLYSALHISYRRDICPSVCLSSIISKWISATKCSPETRVSGDMKYWRYAVIRWGSLSFPAQGASNKRALLHYLYTCQIYPLTALCSVLGRINFVNYNSPSILQVGTGLRLWTAVMLVPGLGLTAKFCGFGLGLRGLALAKNQGQNLGRPENSPLTSIDWSTVTGVNISRSKFSKFLTYLQWAIKAL